MLKTRANRLIFMVCSFFSFIVGSFALSNFFAALFAKRSGETVGVFDWVGDLYYTFSLGEIGFLFFYAFIVVFVFLAIAFVSFFVARLLFGWVVKGQ